MARQIRIHLKWIVAGVVVITFLAALGIEHAWRTVTVEYPMSTWRMDLDDAVTTALAVSMAVAALVGSAAAWRKAGRVEDTVNGGMERMAKEILKEQMEIEGYGSSFIQVLIDVEEIKRQRDECHEELEQLAEVVHRRLDESGKGRKEPRE